MIADILVGDKIVGQDHPVFVIAEAGVNHNGDLEIAERMIDVAVVSGADAVKFQTFRAESLVTRDAAMAQYQSDNLGIASSQFDMLRPLELDRDAHIRLQKHARKSGIIFLSTPFDEESVDMLESLEVPAYKISSGDLTNPPFLSHVAAKKRPILLSTGMSTLDEVRKALAALGSGVEVILLHCTSCYPAELADVNLRAMRTLEMEFGKLTGYSDHTPGIEIPLAAIALGAVVIEKHFTLDRTMSGPDHKASLEPDELSEMIRKIRAISLALGSPVKQPAAAEMGTRIAARKSIVAAKNIATGMAVTRGMLVIMRPGSGIEPEHLDRVSGMTACRDIQAGSTIQWSDLE